MPAIFEDIGFYTENLIAVRKNGRWGFCDHDANLVISYRHEYVWGFKNNISKARKDGRVGYINLEGNEVIPVVYDELSAFKNGRSRVLKNGKYGLIDTDNNQIIPLVFDELEYVDKEIILVKIGQKMAYLNPQNGAVIWKEPGLALDL